jgi:antitoxin HicB
MRTPYSYPATLERDDGGRYVVRFPDLPEALTDGADEDEAISVAADCLSEALASRIVDGEEIPSPTLDAGRHLISPDPTIALKAALYTALRRRDMTVADLADRLGMGDWHQAARLIDPKRSSKLTRLAAALDALGCTIEIAISETEKDESQDATRISRARDELLALSHGELGKVVDAVVVAYCARNAIELDPITRRDLIGALMKDLLEPKAAPGGDERAEGTSSRSAA